MLNKQSTSIRPDLNEWHIAARCGSIERINLLVQNNYPLSKLHEENKSFWLPVNLSKDKATAQKLWNLMPDKDTIDIKKIWSYSIWNNAESIQTKYGIELNKFLMECQFDEKKAKILSKEPNLIQRIELAQFFLANINPKEIIHHPSYCQFKSPIHLAIACCNFFFIEAILSSNIIEWNNMLKEEIKNNYTIGSFYLKKDIAFKVMKKIEHFSGVKLEISQKEDDYIISLKQEIFSDPLKNLEGY